MCNGTSNVCPPPNHKKDGSKCIGGGTCKNGICLSFCESIGKLSCSCDKLETSCKMCCKADVNSVCDTEKNLFNDVYDLSDGSSCIIGTCEKGVCIKQIRKVTERLWNFIETITINKALLFMKENVVASTLFFSLILYIPIAIIIAIVDYKLTKKDEKDVAWRNIKNDQLIFT
ncbi:hypothetical protein A3Q56_04663 [Intoshia linei]|uniref:ADAM17 membrane-proximal domain-containing protein n=1 Tax=Intoshia linei TaxID=1819745 RepID=A0A177B1W9_9BILA|nr:hypothetical protein A3Q56_04663 [Intoshia linei]